MASGQRRMWAETKLSDEEADGHWAVIARLRNPAPLMEAGKIN